MTEEVARAPFRDDTELLELTVGQFVQLMLSLQQTKAVLAAQREEEVTRRIFKDAEGLITGGMQPFRVTTVEQMQKFADDMKPHLARGQGVLCVAVALVEGEVYRCP